jgi:tRNA 2-(methylsulfanyl)-N6-isopentenyladenosine37 hydroxylase
VTDRTDTLRWRTPPGWAEAVLADERALLGDHAHLEQAAASNALALVRRWPDGVDPARWVGWLSGVARDEVEHLAVVSRILADRGGRLARTHRNPYAAALRARAEQAGSGALADRLYVSALIELRSHERFLLLAAADHPLSGLYADLEASEAGHHRLFVQLAELAGGTADRWSWWLDVEAEVAAAQQPGPRMHSGPPYAAG